MGAGLRLPADRCYDRSQHTWVRPEEGGEAAGRVVVGIDALGLEALGELAFVTLSPEGTPVTRGESLGSLEAAKMISDIVAPVSGKIVARNGAVLADPSLVNQDPYGEGWLVSLEPTRWDEEAPDLVAGDAIAPWADEEIARYRAEGWLD